MRAFESCIIKQVITLTSNVFLWTFCTVQCWITCEQTHTAVIPWKPALQLLSNPGLWPWSCSRVSIIKSVPKDDGSPKRSLISWRSIIVKCVSAEAASRLLSTEVPIILNSNEKKKIHWLKKASVLEEKEGPEELRRHPTCLICLLISSSDGAVTGIQLLYRNVIQRLWCLMN